MKIGYCLINSPFKYPLSYLNDILNYKTPSHKSIIFYGIVVVSTKKNPSEINITIPVDDGLAGKACFNFALEVANAFDNMFTNNPQYIFTDDALITNYQNHNLKNADYSTNWDYAVNNNKNLIIEDGTYQPCSFLKICNSFINYVALSGCPIAAGDYLLHNMHSGKKKPHYMTPQSFYTHFQKALHAVKLLDRCYEKELDDTEAKIIFFSSFPKEHIQDYVCHSQCNFDDKTLKDFKHFFKGYYDTNPPKKTDCPTNRLNDRDHAPSRNCILFTNCDDANQSSATKPATSRHPAERPRDCSCSIP